MVQFTIEQNPTFEGMVEIPRIGEECLRVPFTFKYRDRKGLARLYASWTQRQQALAGHLDDEDLVALTDAHIDFQVEQLQEVISGWGFAEPCDAQGIRQLVESSIQIPERILAAYTQAYALARQGN